MKNKRITTEQALSIIFSYHSNPNYGNISDEEIDSATLFLAKYVQSIFSEIPKVLTSCKFDKIEKQNKEIYNSWAFRIMETVDMRCEDKANE